MKQHPRFCSTEFESMKNKEKNPIGHIKKKGKLKLIKDYFVDYTENTSLHGLKYIGERKTSSFEKIFWTITFICSVILCAMQIHKILEKWNESPVLVTFAEKSTPVWQIPYPAVTICSQNKVMPTKFNYTKYFHMYTNSTFNGNLTDEEREMFEDISVVCGLNFIFSSEGRKISIDNIIQVSPSADEVFYSCKWNNDLKSCEELFSSILTEQGICYTFNTLGASDLFREENLHTEYEYLGRRNSTRTWTLDTGYLPSAPLETYPHRGMAYGLESGLKLFFEGAQEAVDYACSGPIQGYKIILHNPAELPRLTHHYVTLPMKQELLIAIKPKMITTSLGLRNLDAERRQCYFQDQRYLLYFKVYTQSNCEMECFSNFTHARCGCVHFGLPRGPNMKVCDANSYLCLKLAVAELMTIDIQAEMDVVANNDTFGEAREVAARCQCLQSCTSIQYEAETSHAYFNLKAYYGALKINPEEAQEFSPSKVMIYFKEAQFITSRRSELYGQTDFLANCGGLLGLFMGFSILSVAEIVYFLTFRFWCVIRRHRRRNLNANEDLQSKAKIEDPVFIKTDDRSPFHIATVETIRHRGAERIVDS